MRPITAETDLIPLNQELAQKTLPELLAWSLATFGDGIAQVTSFGPTGMVLLNHLTQLNPGLRVITIDTDFLFDETYQLWEEVQRRFPIQLDVRRSALPLDTQATLYQPELWLLNPDWCCYLRKVVPLEGALEGLSAWYTGLRRDQGSSRAELPFVQWDKRYQLVKLNPMVNWTRKTVWQYISQHNLPYNKLHDQGYASIGCTHCTKPTFSLNNERAGRWNGQDKVECGIHLSSSAPFTPQPATAV